MSQSRYIFKILVAGDGGVGKTSLLVKYVNGTFLADANMTIGINFHVRTCTLDDGRRASLQLWDFGGQERFRFMLPSYTLGAKGAMLLYDSTRFSTLENLREWVDICRTHDKELPILFVGTKIDLKEQRSVDPDYAREQMADLGLFDYVEVSAKTGENVDRAFEMIVRKIFERQEAGGA